MKRFACAVAGLAVLAGTAFAQVPAGSVEVTADGCKLYLPQAEARGASRIRWSGKCADGFADGRGVVRIYQSGKISRVSEATFTAGKLTAPGESYSIRGGHAIRSRGGDKLEVSAAELPTWALELSLLVEDKPVRAAAPPPPPKVDRAAEERAAAEAQRDRALAEAKAAKDAERQRALAASKLAQERAAAEKAKAGVFVAGRGFADGGAGEPMRAVVSFKLTTAEGRQLGVATFVPPSTRRFRRFTRSCSSSRKSARRAAGRAT